MAKLIRFIDEEDSKYTYLIAVKENQFNRAKRLIDMLISKWYGNRNDYYSKRYGGVMNFIDYKLQQANIQFDTPLIEDIYF